MGTRHCSIGTVARLALWSLLAMGCTAPRQEAADRPDHSYLFVLAGDKGEGQPQSDFMAVIDADSTSGTYGQVVATTGKR